MNTKNYIKLIFAVAPAILFSLPTMADATIYDNSIIAQNINMLTDTFVSYTRNGETLSDLFTDKKFYGTMRRIDEYGDDGTTLKNNYDDDTYSDSFIKNVWADARHINEHAHYDNIAKRARFNIATAGATTKSINLKYGDMYFGTFAGYINSDTGHIDSNGAVGGIFAHYDFQKIGATILADIGSLNNDSGNAKFNNFWTHVATDTDVKFYIDKTFLIQPGLSVAYTFVSSDDLSVNNNVVSSDNFNFLNLAPYVRFVKQIVPDWCGALSAKYVAHFGGDNDIYVAGTKYDGIDTDNYTDLGLDIEYKFRRFVFDGSVHKQIGGFDGWSGNITLKYQF